MKKYTTKKAINELSYAIIGCAITVHKYLGSGLLESVYQKCLKEELNYNNIHYQTELIIPLEYKNIQLDIDYRCDLFVEESIVVELKSVIDMIPLFESQVLTYMKLLECPKGILLNFNCNNLFKEGQKTYVNEYFRELPDY